MKYSFSALLLLFLLPFAPTSQTDLCKAALQNAEGDSLLIDGLKKEPYLTAADIAYMHQQCKENRSGIWTAETAGDVSLLPVTETPATGLSPKKATKAWTKYFKTHTAGFYELSRPVYSKDGNTAVICVNFQCGVYCGNGGAYVFRLLNGEWKAVKNCYSWKK
jgi:hypothetical protein